MLESRKERAMTATDLPLLHAALVFLTKDGDVLLFRKKESAKIGPGTRNGPGGMLDPGDDSDICRTAVRELSEECGITASAKDLQPVAVVDFHNRKDTESEFIVRVHTFLLSAWRGAVAETPEMLDPRWYPRRALPLQQMLPADRFWLPPLFDGKILYAQAWYGPRQQRLLRPVTITEVPLDELFRLRPAA